MLMKLKKYLKDKFFSKNTVEKMGNLIYVFQTFRKVNIATYLYEKTFQSLLWEWLYYVIPIMVFSGNILMLICNRVLYSPSNEFTYFNDLSNSLCLTLLYFLSYFLSGYYPLKFDEFIRKGINKETIKEIAEYTLHRKKSNKLLIFIGVILFCIGFGAGYSFYSVAKSNSTAYWIRHLDIYGRVYYCLFLGITWYHSLSLLGMAITSGFLVYWTIRSQTLIYLEEDFNKNLSIISAVDIVFSTFSYGLLYIIGAFLFIFNDRVAEKYGVYNMFYKDMPSFILVFSISLLVVLAYLPLQKLLIFMKMKKEILINSLNERIFNEKLPDRKEHFIEKRNDLIKQNLIDTSITNKIVFILSVLIPSIGVVFQGIDLFIK